MGAIRDVVQNHPMQLLSNIVRQPPPGIDIELFRDERFKALRTIQPIGLEDVIRGQFRGYLDEPGVRSDPQVETYVGAAPYLNSNGASLGSTTSNNPGAPRPGTRP